MPSKTKKRSKTPSNPSNSGQSVSSPAISSSASPSETELKEDDIRGLLDEAAIEYPSFISKDAFVGRLTGAESYSSSSHTAVIWLSESAMVASSIVSGSIVSVSLAASKKKLESSFPLYPFVNDYARRYDIGAPDKRTNEAGSYFALAVVYPSCKVLKNEVQLSWSLSCTMGNPAPGMTTFVFPIQCHSTVGLPNGFHKGHNFSNISVSCLKLWNCKDLYLELVPSKNDDVLLLTNSKSELDYDRPENGISLSPRTPLPYQSKLNPSSVKHLPLRRCQDSVSNVCPSNGTLFSTYDIGNALGDRKSRELLQVPVAHWLHARHLLHGNFVAIPIGGQIFSFRVEGAREEDSLSIGNNALLPCEAQNLNADRGNSVFIIGQGTKVHLSSSKLLEKQIPVEEGFSSVDLESRDSRDKEACYVPKLGGLAKEFGILKEIIISSSVKSTLSSLGLRTTKGVLLHGPPGTGKTSLALSCVNYAGVNLFSVNGPELISQFFGESEQALHEVFDSASQAAPAVVFIDELDAIAPARKDGSEELSQRMVATLLTLMDGIGTSDGILVIAATNRPNSIDPALRRPGRFDQEIEIGVPSPKQRLDILQMVLSEMTHSLVDAQVQHLALSMHGFVGADIAALCNEAALVCLRRYVNLKKTSDSSSGTVDEVQCKESFVGYNCCSDYILGASDCSNGNTHVIDSEESVSPSNDVIGGSDVSNGTMHVIDSGESVSPSTSYLTASTKAVQSFQFDAEYQRGNYTTLRAVHYDNDKVASIVGEEDFLKVTFDDFEKAKMKVRPSAMREVMLEIPKVSWEDVGGQKEVKMQLMEAVEWPQKHQDAFMRIGTQPPTGVLMFGPPGCSKTLMARAVASEAGLNFLAVKGPELFSKWVGESEKAVKSLFAKARANAPSVIFFDEIDGLAIVRGKESDGASVGDRVMSQLLVELDGLHQRVNVTVIAATNRPDKIDPALLRPGRFDRLLYVGPPNEIDREDIFRIHVQKMPCGSDVSIRELAYLTKGCTGADISLICREAALAAIEENLDTSVISMEHFKIGLGRVQPSDICSDQEFSMKFQRLVLSGAEKDDEEYQPTRSLASRIAFGTWLKSLFYLLFRRTAVFSSSKASP